MSLTTPSTLPILRMLFAAGLPILAIPAWRKGWRRPVLVAVAVGLAASVAAQLVVPSVSGDVLPAKGGSAATVLIELVSLPVRWLSMAALVWLASSRPAGGESKSGKQI